MAAAEWPTSAELKQRLDITSDDWDDQLARLLAAAIAQTKQRVGDWVEDFDQPNEAIAQSALELAVELSATRDEFARIRGTDVLVDRSKSKQLLMGHRRRFGIG
jgi:hypothetical protein